jgi:hypothetical protein
MIRLPPKEDKSLTGIILATAEVIDDTLYDELCFFLCRLMPDV